MATSAPHAPSRSALPVFVILLSLIIYFGISIGQTVTQINQNRQRLEQLRIQVAQLRQKKSNLETELALHRQPAYIEAEARNQLSLAKDGETTVIFPLSARVLGASASAAPATKQSPSNSLPQSLSAWQHFFF